MERKIKKELIAWKNSTTRLPFILHGARQVGKTYTVSEFGREQYRNFVYLNFEANPQLQAVFERDLLPERIIRELSVLMETTIEPETTLLFFDEIQACERALTSLKYFAENAPNYPIIAAGSLLGIAINREKHSFPVGKVTLRILYPLDFEEFLWAIGQENATQIIRECFETNMTCSLHTHFLDLFKLYLCLGGMPQVIKTYLQDKNFEEVALVQRFIVDSYIADMAKYSQPVDTVKIMAAYNSIPAQLAKENKKFQFKIIKPGARSNQYEMAIDWLCASGIVHKCTKTTQGKYPLSAFSEFSFYKIYMGDVGLLRSKLGISVQLILTENELLNHIKGALTENYVENVLVNNGLESYYWESEGKAEVDFVYQTKNGACIPIEVKSSENVRAKSLQQYVLKYNPPFAIRISKKNFGFENNVKSVPLYACFCIKE